MAAGVEGRDDGKPMDSYILKIWKAFTAEWRRRTGIELPEAVINSGVHVSGLQPPRYLGRCPKRNQNQTDYLTTLAVDQK